MVMKNIHVLPTDKPSRLILQTNGKLRLSDIIFKGQVASGVTQNICITSDEEIKEGDWCISLCDDESYEEIYQCKYIDLVDEEDKKIILTTDQDLIKDGVQPIPDEFLEWFIKNPSCEKVTVTKNIGLADYSKSIENYKYKIIIPKEELKQETLEETAERMVKEHPDFESEGFSDYQNGRFNGIIEGIKYQQERSYSEEEVNEIIAEAWNSCEDNEGETFTEVRKRIIEQFKKK